MKDDEITELEAVAQGLNAINDNAGAWTPDVIRAHCRGLAAILPNRDSLRILRAAVPILSDEPYLAEAIGLIADALDADDQVAGNVALLRAAGALVREVLGSDDLAGNLPAIQRKLILEANERAKANA